MPEDNLQPSPQPNQLDNSATSPRVMQPTNSNVVSPPSSDPQPIVPSVTTQPTAVANGQPFQPTTPMSRSELEQLSDKKPSKWRHFFIVLGVLQALGACSFLFLVTISGQPDSEFVALAWFATVVPAVGIASLINLIGLPIYMAKQKLHGKGLVFAILSLIISFALFLFGAYSVYQLRVAAPKHLNELSTRGEKTISASDAVTKIQNCEVERLIIRYYYKGGDAPGNLFIKGQNTALTVNKNDLASVQQAIKTSNQKCGNVPILYENDNGDLSVVSSISFDKAKELLLSCKLQFVEMPMEQKYLTKTKMKALEATGIYEVGDFGGAPISIGFNESTRSKITPVARQVATQCKGINFMLSPGHWSQNI